MRYMKHIISTSFYGKVQCHPCEFNVIAHFLGSTPWSTSGPMPWSTSGPTPKSIGSFTWLCSSWLYTLRLISWEAHPLRWPILQAIHSTSQPSPEVRGHLTLWYTPPHKPSHLTSRVTLYVSGHILCVQSAYESGHLTEWVTL